MQPPTATRRRPDRRRQARAALVSAVLAFVGLQGALLAAIELRPRLRDPLFGDKAARLYRRIAEPGPKPTTVVMIGSSRTGFGFHGQRVEEAFRNEIGGRCVAFNFGIPASGPITHLIYLRRLLNDGLRPDLLLVEVLPPMLASQVPGPVEKHWLYADRLRRDELEIVAHYGFPQREMRSAWWETCLTPWYSLRFPLMGRVAPGWLPWSVRYDWSRGTDECGWGTPIRTEVTPNEYRQGVAQAHAEYAAVLATLEIDGSASQALRDLLELCRREKVPVALVLMPEGTDFRSWYPPAVRAKVEAFLNGACREYGASLIDAREWVPDRCFTDSHHMLRSGAEIFTDRLGREAILPRFRPAKQALGVR